MFISTDNETGSTLPVLYYHKISLFCSFNLGGGGRAGAKFIMTNANTNENTGASVTVNSRAPEAPSDGSGDGRSDGYGRWDYKPYYHRSGGAPKAPKGQGCPWCGK